jgi:hypothetical protein
MSRQAPSKWLFVEDYPIKRECNAVQQMTREEIERRMDELARKYVETRNHEIIDELYKLRLELEKIKRKSLD